MILVMYIMKLNIFLRECLSTSVDNKFVGWITGKPWFQYGVLTKFAMTNETITEFCVKRIIGI